MKEKKKEAQGKVLALWLTVEVWHGLSVLELSSSRSTKIAS